MFNILIGVEVYSSWEPTPEELQLIKENGGLKKVHDGSYIGKVYILKIKFGNSILS